jgi:hypothetical protein
MIRKITRARLGDFKIPHVQTKNKERAGDISFYVSFPYSPLVG